MLKPDETVGYEEGRSSEQDIQWEERPEEKPDFSETQELPALYFMTQIKS